MKKLGKTCFLVILLILLICYFWSALLMYLGYLERRSKRKHLGVLADYMKDQYRTQIVNLASG